MTLSGAPLPVVGASRGAREASIVAGTAAVTSVGSDLDEVFAALCAGRPGLAPLRAFDAGAYGADNAYEIDDRPPGGGDLPGRATRWLVRAIGDALEDAGLGEDLSETPVLVGTGLRELRSIELWWRDGAAFAARDLDFHGALRDRFGATSVFTFANACSASLHALALGEDLLALGEADTVVVAGVDAITESMFGLLDRVQLDPPEAVRPFDRARRGVLMGDGAAAVVLRRAPGGPGRGLLRGVGLSCDAGHLTAPDRAGVVAAMRDAYDRAGVTAAEVDLVLLHGTGTVLNDETEALALREVFGAHAGRPLVTAIKSMTGHTSGGSGLIGVAVALRALTTGRVPPTLGLVDPIEAAAGLRFVLGTEVTAAPRVAQVDAFGFGGVNAVAILEAS